MEQFNMTQFTPEDVEIASALTDDELRARIAMYQNILESRKPVNMVSIDWEGSVQDIRKGKPYFAILTMVHSIMNFYQLLAMILVNQKQRRNNEVQTKILE